MRTSSYHERDEEVRFWMSVKSGPTCWLWRGPIDGRGYAKFVVNGKHNIASRYSWQLHFGEILDSSILVCHTCDNKLCINPHHLFLGTHQHNSLDMSDKGRSCQGERNQQAKLNTEQVLEIRLRRANGESLASLADEFGVSFQQISLIAIGKSWAHIE